jgi:hypothetical protein
VPSTFFTDVTKSREVSVDEIVSIETSSICPSVLLKSGKEIRIDSAKRVALVVRALRAWEDQNGLLQIWQHVTSSRLIRVDLIETAVRTPGYEYVTLAASNDDYRIIPDCVSSFFGRRNQWLNDQFADLRH